MVRANKRLGQHFLRDRSVVERTTNVLGATKADLVIEIGPGHGVLTEALAHVAGEVIAVELDRTLAASLKYTMPPNVQVVHGDILDRSQEALLELRNTDGDVYVAGNLPYQISSPLTFQVLDWAFVRAVFLYQLEFAERLVADVGDEHYGRLSVARAYRAEAEIVRRVKPGAFVPVPKVMSGLVVLDPHPEPPFDVGPDVAFFDAVVRECFGQRRKTLRKALSNRAEVLGLPKMGTTEATAFIEEAGVAAERVEEVAPDGYGRLARALHPHRKPPARITSRSGEEE
ncbi:MAG: 16S rRNA (adenine(1518)-N(6)/adenine(1519)-N(6))-dimethyltransferase RsmA [Euryarchaeota archaeon]|nr:16S rRNA (adenine(1518)-N(6)/adenine(1519)-N(6))-dimethyltransferase RsmA [Euryarchaeota archaeon]